MAEDDKIISGKEFLKERHENYLEKRELLEVFKKEKQELSNELIGIVKKYFAQLMLYDVNKDVAKYIANRKMEGTLFPNISEDVIKESIESCNCQLCGGMLTGGQLEKMRELIHKIQSNLSSQVISDISKDVSRALDLREYKKEKESKNEQIRAKEHQIEEMENTVNELWQEISRFGGDDAAKVVENAIKRRDKNSKLYEYNKEKQTI